jgi:streptomycin 6-kinase
MNVFDVPEHLLHSCRESPERMEWLGTLRGIITDLASRWSLTLEPPFERDVSCAWVAPGLRGDLPVVLKIGMPHMEAEDEIAGLRFWDGDPTVRLLEADALVGAMLLERCVPGSSLRELPESEQDSIIAKLLRRLWSKRADAAPFRPLHALVSYWSDATLARANDWPDPPLVHDGLALMQQLALDNDHPTVPLATDLHAGNILRAQRASWLVIDPKPFLGDPAFDATQHLLNCRERLIGNPDQLVGHFCNLLDVDPMRVRLWLFARAASEPRGRWAPASMSLARLLRPT